MVFLIMFPLSTRSLRVTRHTLPYNTLSRRIRFNSPPAVMFGCVGMLVIFVSQTLLLLSLPMPSIPHGGFSNLTCQLMILNMNLSSRISCDTSLLIPSPLVTLMPILHLVFIRIIRMQPLFEPSSMTFMIILTRCILIFRMHHTYPQHLTLTPTPL